MYIQGNNDTHGLYMYCMEVIKWIENKFFQLTSSSPYMHV